ncbi:MAG: cytochrome b [Proteobacteria bacterium]|nr:cytochrome b [Pseudomonadota bacterium]
MLIKNTQENFGIIAILLHWLMAILIIALLIVGIYMTYLPLNAQKLKLYGLHKEYGILALMLVIIRLFWRFSNLTPTLPATMPVLEKLAARGVHFLFYILMFALPITGWLLSSASGLPVSFFGWFVLPDLVNPNENWRFLLTETHLWLGYALVAAIVGHMGAALFHHFVHKNDILRRMIP